MKWLKRHYSGLSIQNKFILCSVLIILFLVLAMTISTRSLVTKTVTQTTTENYVQKFETVSHNFLRLFSSTEQLSDIIITDSEVQYFLKNIHNLNTADKLQKKIMVENYLDFLDSAKSYNQFSNIAVISNNVDIMTTNKIRNNVQGRLPLYESIHEQNPRKTWIDLFPPEEVRSGENRIMFVKSVIDYTSGLSMGHIAIDINHDILLDNFSELNYGESGSFLVADLDGNIKISADDLPIGGLSDNISSEPFFDWGLLNPSSGKVFQTKSGNYLITTSKLDRLGWIMFGIIPLKELTEVGEKIVATIYIVGIVAVIIASLLTRYLTANITKPINNLTSSMKRFGAGDFNIRLPLQSNDEIGMLSTVFNRMIAQISELIEQVKREQRSKSRFEFAALQAQINPHFLYNTLSSTCSLITMHRNAEAFTMINAISTFYRTVLSSGENIIPIKNELDNINSYIQIQSIRYGEKIQYAIDIGPELHELKIVKFSLQPIIENAIYHGVKNKENGIGHISVTGFKEGNEVFIRVEDNGIGMPEELTQQLLRENGEQAGKTSFGLISIDKRIKLYFGNPYGISIASKAGFGTAVTIRLPEAYSKGAYEHDESINR